MDELTTEQKAILDFEHKRWKYAGAKEAKIRELFGISVNVYYQRLNHAINLPAAVAYDVLGVKRLRNLRDAGRRARTA